MAHGWLTPRKDEEYSQVAELVYAFKFKPIKVWECLRYSFSEFTAKNIRLFKTR